MASKRSLFSMTLALALALGTWSSAEPSWAQLPGVPNLLGDGVDKAKQKLIEEGKQKLIEGTAKAKAELRKRLEKEMSVQLDQGEKQLDEKLAQALKGK